MTSSDQQRRFQFGLKEILLATVFVALVVAGYLAAIRPGQIRAELQSRVANLGGTMYVSEDLSIITFQDVPLTDAQLAELIPLMRKCDNLYVIDLSGTQITDASIPALDTLPEELQRQTNLDRTAVSDSGKLRICGLTLTEEQTKQLMQRLKQLNEKAE